MLLLRRDRNRTKKKSRPTSALDRRTTDTAVGGRVARMAMREHSTTIVTTIRGQANARDGRLGHEAKNIASGMLLAALQGWAYQPPSAAGAYGFKEVDEVINLQRLADEPPLVLLSGDAPSRWTGTPGTCPTDWPVVVLNDTGFAGIEQHSEFEAYLQRKIPAQKVVPRLCIHTTNGFRLHLHHAYAWEKRGLVRAGAYALVTRALQRAFRRSEVQPLHPPHPPKPQRPSVPSARRASKRAAMASQQLDKPRRGTIAVHVRRGDRVGRGATSRYPMSLVRAFVGISGSALLGTGLFPAVDVTIYTEPGNSSELFESGCPSSMPRGVDPGSIEGGMPAARLTCRVTSGSVLHDLQQLVAADVLGLSSSSFSVLAYYLRGVAQPALSPVKTVAQFFAATDGSDGRSLSNSSRAAARRTLLAPPPANLLFLYQFLQQSEQAGSASGGGAATLSAADPIGMSLLFMLKQLTKELQRLLRSPK